LIPNLSAARDSTPVQSAVAANRRRIRRPLIDGEAMGVRRERPVFTAPTLLVFFGRHLIHTT